MAVVTPTRAALALLAPLLLAGCGMFGGGAADPPPRVLPSRNVEPIPDRNRLFSDDKTPVDSTRVLITDQQTLELWWSRATAEAAEPRPSVPTDIDFESQSVLLVAAGPSDNGDRIRVDSLGFEVRPTAGGGQTEVWFAVVHTVEECDPFPGTTYPLEIVRVGTDLESVTWQERRTGCSASSPAASPSPPEPTAAAPAPSRPTGPLDAPHGRR